MRVRAATMSLTVGASMAVFVALGLLCYTPYLVSPRCIGDLMRGPV